MSRVTALARNSTLGAALLLSSLLPSLQCSATTSFKVLYDFTGTNDGGQPAYGSLVLDANGNLYGTTELLAGSNAGEVFRLAPDGGFTVLHAFSEGSGGSGPDALVMDKKGNLWGTADGSGGASGCGVIFEIMKAGSEKVVHTFAGAPNDGCGAFGAMIVDGDGNFYGTSTGGGKYSNGAVFKLAPNGTLKLLHSFDFGRGGRIPFAGLYMDASGNLYGVAGDGGKKGFGTAFRITATGREKVVYTFKGPPRDGGISDSTLIRDQSGNFYGTLYAGGKVGCDDGGCGAVFKLAPDGTESILHFFTGKRNDGANPGAGVIADSAGNLYGTTKFGGGSCTAEQAYGCGTVFEIAPDGTETVLYNFSKNNGANGAIPVGGLVADAAGNIYGTANQGGKYGYGTIFEITPWPERVLLQSAE